MYSLTFYYIDMEASISFNIYEDFSKYLENESDNSKALKHLNSLLKKLVKEDKLIITYKGKKVKILLPIKDGDVGNIFGKEDLEGAHWNDVQIFCKINCDEEDFDGEEFQVKECPIYFDPFMIYY